MLLNREFKIRQKKQIIRTHIGTILAKIERKPF